MKYIIWAVAILAAGIASAAPPSSGGGEELVNVHETYSFTTPHSSRVQLTVFVVPPGKVLVAEYVSIMLDAVIRNRPSTGLRIEASLTGRKGTAPGAVPFRLGYMEELPMTSRGAPNFLIGSNMTAYFPEGPVYCAADTRYAGSNVDYGALFCSLAGRLIDAR